MTRPASTKPVISLVTCPSDPIHFLTQDDMAIDDLGLGYLYTALERNGHSVFLFDSIHFTPSLNPPLDELCHRILNTNSSYVGFSDPLKYFSDSLVLSRILKERSPDITIIYGDIHASLYPVEILVNEPQIDFVICGEADRSLPELIEALESNQSISDIPGLCFRTDDGIELNPPDFTIDLDTLPFPFRPSLTDSRPNERLIYNIVTSRGCTEYCTFCSLSTFLSLNCKSTTERWRTRSSRSVFDEIRSLYKYGARKFYFCDDNLLGPREAGLPRLLDLAEMIVNQKYTDISFFTMIRPDSLVSTDTGALSLLKKAGLSMLIVGLEASNEAQLKAYGKKYNLSETRKFIGLALENQIMIHLMYIMFFPYSTFDMLRKNVRFLSDAGLAHLFDVYFTVLTPHSRIAIEKKLQRDNLLLRPTTYEVPGVYTFKDRRIEKLYNIVHSVFSSEILTTFLLLEIGIEISRYSDSHQDLFNRYLSSMKKIGDASEGLFIFCLDAVEMGMVEDASSEYLRAEIYKWREVVQEERQKMMELKNQTLNP